MPFTQGEHDIAEPQAIACPAVAIKRRGPGTFCRLVTVGMLAPWLAGCGWILARWQHPTPPAVTIGAQGRAYWTSTTKEAASTPRHRKILQQGRPTTIIGEVVDVSCFLQLGKRGDAHVPCGQKCVRNGQPVGVLTDQGRLYLIIPEEHHPRRDGQVNLSERFGELMGKRVQISGMAMQYQDARALFVRTLPEEAPSLVPPS